MSPEDPRPEQASRELLVNAGQLAGLWTLGIAYPLFQSLTRLAGTNVVLMGWTALDVVAFAVALSLGPPIGLATLEALAGCIHKPLRAVLHAVFMGLLSGVLAMYLLKKGLYPRGWILGVTGLAVGMLTFVAYVRSAVVRSFFTFLSVAPVASIGLFLLTPPISPLVIPQSQERAAGSNGSTPVVMVVFDEFPVVSIMRVDEGLAADAYPNFAALAVDSTWFRNATTVYDMTHVAVPAIISGRRPSTRAPPSIAAYPDNLFVPLRRSHAVHADELSSRLCPRELCPAKRSPPFPRRLTNFLPYLARSSAQKFLPERLSAKPTWPEAVTPDQVRMRRLADSIEREPRAGFFFIHSFAPHEPWDRLPTGEQYQDVLCCIQDWWPDYRGAREIAFGPPAPEWDRWTSNRLIVARQQQRHLAQARYADRLLGMILRSLRRSGKYDRSLIVVTADHGIGFGPGSSARRLSEANVGEVLGVPLFVKLPFQREGSINDAFVRTTDVAGMIERTVRAGASPPTWGRVAVVSQRGRLVAFNTLTGRRRTFSQGAYLATRRAALRRTWSLFGGPAEQQGLFRFGPAPELIGRSPASLRMLPGDGGTATLINSKAFDDVNPRTKPIPALVCGTLTGGKGPTILSQNVAIALNGRIVATTVPYRSVTGDIRFASVLPPGTLRPGSSVVRLYGISEDPGGPRLTPLRMIRA